jgi:hypothetical protein
MNLKPLPRVLNNGAHVLAYCEIDGHYLVLAWWARGEYISWWVIPEGGSAYAGQYSHEWSKACKAFEARRGGRGKGLQELIDEDSPALMNLDGYFPEDLDEIAQDETRPRFYREYAHQKARAMRKRADGRITQATTEENICESLYNAMPEGFKW